ncbi:MAG: hypothetical protein JWN70_5933 [Planctomycetaceae bacterium]|nr:hypothetical protein [Planctomycetaceae bacterium]
MICARRAVTAFAGVVLSMLFSVDIEAADKASASETLVVLKGLENVRTHFKPFTVRGTATRPVLGKDHKVEFRADCEAMKYRITSRPGLSTVSVYDGTRLLLYDGNNSATISTPDHRTSTLAFDPRSLGLATGLYSDLLLETNLAYRAAEDIVIAEIPVARQQPGLVGIELTDRFGQRIHFEIDDRAPYRLRYYSKTIPRTDGKGVFVKYVTESEYWADQPESWIPRKLTMYTLEEGRADRRRVDMIVDLERPESVAAFDPSIWTISGLSLPFGQPVADLRIRERIGYWNGKELVKDVP